MYETLTAMQILEGFRISEISSMMARGLETNDLNLIGVSFEALIRRRAYVEIAERLYMQKKFNIKSPSVIALSGCLMRSAKSCPQLGLFGKALTEATENWVGNEFRYVDHFLRPLKVLCASAYKLTHENIQRECQNLKDARAVDFVLDNRGEYIAIYLSESEDYEQGIPKKFKDALPYFNYNF